MSSSFWDCHRVSGIVIEKAASHQTVNTSCRSTQALRHCRFELAVRIKSAAGRVGGLDCCRHDCQPVLRVMLAGRKMRFLPFALPNEVGLLVSAVLILVRQATHPAC